MQPMPMPPYVAASSPNYGTLNPAPKRKHVLGEPAYPGPAFWESVLYSFLIFFVTLSAHAFLLFYHGFAVVAITIASAVALIGLLLGIRQKRMSMPKRFGAFGVVPPAAALVAICFGTLLGPVGYTLYGKPATTYGVARMYTDVGPWQPATSVADAGRIVFASDARLELSQAVGYFADDGKTYCAAPVSNVNASKHTEFWAVGTGCCDVKGGTFDCDAAARGSARGGAVVLDSQGLFPGGGEKLRGYLDSARRKAEALWGLSNSTDAVYLRWTETDVLEQLPQDYSRKAWIFICWGSVCYTIVVGTLLFKILGGFIKGR